MSKIAILTDSTANLTAEDIKHHKIHVIPLNIHWKGKSLLDGVDISPTEFIQTLSKESELPTTSQPAASQFLELFTKLGEEHEGIFTALISSGISGTVDSALMAVNEYKGVPVEVLDTKLTSTGLAMVVLAAARAIEDGKSLAEVSQIAEKISLSTNMYFMVDSLYHLHRGGRIGGASWLLGSALNIKPLLYLTPEGKIDALERVRTRTKAIERLSELVTQKVGTAPAHVGIIHADSPDVAQSLRSMIEAKIQPVEMIIADLSPVIAAHVGPGTIGVGVYTD
jgi:DegV family protein with EDD domain